MTGDKAICGLRSWIVDWTSVGTIEHPSGRACCGTSVPAPLHCIRYSLWREHRQKSPSTSSGGVVPTTQSLDRPCLGTNFVDLSESTRFTGWKSIRTGKATSDYICETEVSCMPTASGAMTWFLRHVQKRIPFRRSILGQSTWCHGSQCCSN